MRSIVVEWSTRATVENVREDAVHVPEHLYGWNAERLIPQRFKYSIAPSIALRTITVAVIIAINFDQKTASETGKVRDVAANGILLSEFQAIRLSAQNIPKQNFRQGHLTPKLAS